MTALRLAIPAMLCLSAACLAQDQPMPPESQPAKPATVLFEDPMSADWSERWFTDGKQVQLEHRNGGLAYTAPSSGVDKRVDRAAFDAAHAVLWTKQEFEGDIRISYESTKLSKGWTVLVYIQAQGIGLPPYVNDIHAWRELRDVASMNMYYNYMSCLSMSFREDVRLRRYPLHDVQREIDFKGALFDPKLQYDGMPTGTPYRVVIEKRLKSLTLRVQDLAGQGQPLAHTWDLTRNPEQQMPRLIERGRIGLRHMGGSSVFYRNFRVERLE